MLRCVRGDVSSTLVNYQIKTMTTPDAERSVINNIRHIDAAYS